MKRRNFTNPPPIKRAWILDGLVILAINVWLHCSCDPLFGRPTETHFDFLEDFNPLGHDEAQFRKEPLTAHVVLAYTGYQYVL